MWGMKAWQIRQQREWIETLCMQRDDANREAESRRNVVKRLAAQVEEQRQQNLRLVRDNRTLREELARRSAALEGEGKRAASYLKRLRDAGLETWSEVTLSSFTQSLTLTALDDPTAAPLTGPAQLVTEREFLAKVHDAIERQAKQEQADCPHTGRLDTSENGGSVVVCTACLEVLDQTDDSGDEAAADEEDGA